MVAKRRSFIVSIVVLAALVYSLTSPLAAMADDATPPPPDTSEAAPSEEAPVQEASTEEAPTEEVATEAAPTEEAVTEAAPTEAAATEEAATESAATDAAATEAASTETAATETASTEAVATDAASTEAVATDAASSADTHTLEPLAEEGPALSEVVQAAADAGVTLTDSSGAPLEMGTLEAATTLLSGDPYFQVGAVTYRFFPNGGSCAGYNLGVDCFVSGPG